MNLLCHMLKNKVMQNFSLILKSKYITVDFELAIYHTKRYGLNYQKYINNRL